MLTEVTMAACERNGVGPPGPDSGGVPTHDGGGQHVLPQQEQASSTVVELVNHFTVKKGGGGIVPMSTK